MLDALDATDLSSLPVSVRFLLSTENKLAARQVFYITLYTCISVGLALSISPSLAPLVPFHQSFIYPFRCIVVGI